MPKGIVKWFNNAKGFGFILSDDSKEDIFAHYSAIEMDGFRTLKAGQPVEFDLQNGQKGLHAVNIRSNEAPYASSGIKVPTHEANPEKMQRTSVGTIAESEPV
jgi:CspA family cold shock protein